MIKICLIISLWILPCASPAVEANNWSRITIHPLKEASKDSSLSSFLDSLKAAIETRDTAFIFLHLHPQAESSYGEARGKESFKKFWKLQEPDSPFWLELKSTLALGGAFRTGKAGEKYYLSPYRVSVKKHPFLPGMDNELKKVYYQEAGAVVVDSAVVYFGQDKDSGIKGFRNDDISTSSIPANQDSLVKILLPDWSTVAYTECKYISGPAMDYRACLINVDGRWMIYHFVGGF